ncbi:STE23_2 [Sanghuangporus vaninii]
MFARPPDFHSLFTFTTTTFATSPGDSGLWEVGHVFQLVSLKKIGAAREGSVPDRYRIVISDGINYTQAMLATQLNHMVEDGELKKNSIVKVEKLTCNVVQSKRVFILLSLTPLAHPEEKIGDPTSLDVPGRSGTANGEASEAPVTTDNTPANQTNRQNNAPVQRPQARANAPVIFPIEGLSPYQNKWTIRARVTAKSDIRQWSNQKGEGQLFTVTFMDESGEIRATGFNQQVEQFYDKLEEGKVYYVSKARVNLAKKKFTNVQNEYELSLNRDTEIVECEDQADAPQIKYNFVPLSELGEVQKDATCDVIGIVKDVSEVTEIIARSSSRATKKRELTLVDRTEYSVRMTLWGKQAESYNAEEHAVLAFKGARVSDFGGRSLSMLNSTHMAVNPDITEAHILRGWFDSLNAAPAFKSHSGAAGIGSGSATFRRDQMLPLAQVRDSQIGMTDGGEQFSCRGTIVHIKTDNLYYPACPNDSCNRKIIETNEGWRCEKCDRSYKDPEYRYIMSMSVADYTGQLWLQGFNDVGLVVFGRPANELHDLKERDESAFNAAVAKSTCNTYNFNCRAKQDTYNETTRVRYGVQKILPLDYKVEAGILRDMLKSERAKHTQVEVDVMRDDNWLISRVLNFSGSLFALATGILRLLGLMRPLAYLRSCIRPLALSPHSLPSLHSFRLPLIYSLKFGSNTRSYARPALAPDLNSSPHPNTPGSSILNGLHPSANMTVEEDAKNWSYVPAQDDRPGHFLYGAPIQKSPADDREYRVIRLENGLQAVLVHDAKTDKAAASLDVAVGHLSDPDDIPGLAHFCEHLLFMGTEQFPKENEYSEYLAKNSGESNAFTSASNTNYYFSVASNALEGALERFSGFFHSPLFSPSCTLRELNAVDSENKKNIQNDMWRIFQLTKHLTRPGHPWKKFGTGNKATLTEAARSAKARSGNLPAEKPSLNNFLNGNGNASTLPSPIPSRIASPAPSVNSTNSENEADGGSVGRETRRRLIEWWSKEYCAGRMSLVIIGKESLDDLARMAAVMFSPIRNRQQDPLPLILEHPFGNDERASIVHAKTIMDFYAFEISFPLPYQAPHWRVKPANYLAHFVGHEGPGSLHAYLKNKGWIISLSAGEQRLGRGFEIFKVSVQLSKEGFQNYRQAVLACYKYLNLLRSTELQQWVQDEIQTLSMLNFRFAEKQRRPENYATWISDHVKMPIPRSLILSGPKLTWDWDEHLVREMLGQLTVDSGRVVVMAKDHSIIGKTGPWTTEPWYGTEYTVEKVDPEFMAAARTPNDIPELFLPGPNEFVPDNVEVEKIEVPQPAKRPSLIKSTPLVDVWHKKDDQFWVPRAQVIVEARTPFAGSSARASVMTRLYVDLVKDSLTEFSYDASLAGLQYDLGSSMLGLCMTLSGYNDKLHVLAQHVLEKTRNLDISEDRLAVIKENVKLQWQNFFLGQTYSLSEYYGRYLLAGRQYTLMEKLAEIDSITVEELRKHAQKLLSQFKYFVLVNGNLRKEDANRIASTSEDILSSEAVPADQVPVERSRLLSNPCNYIWELPVPNPDQVNASNSYYCHVGSISDARVRTTFRLLAQILHEPAFNILRTKEQLGYIVFTSAWQGVESLGLRILVQSEKDPKYLETRIEAFLDHMRGVIETMDDEQFEEHKKSLEQKWTEKLKNLQEEATRFWTHIDSGYLDFTRREHDAALLATVTKDDVLAMFKEFIDPASPKRSKLSVHMRPQKQPTAKLSQAAADGFLSALHGAGVFVDLEEFNSLCTDEPPVAKVREHWESALQDQPNVNGSELLAKFDELVRSHPAVGQGAVELNPSVQYITDGAAFRESLRLSDPARPVDEAEVALSRF